MEEELVPAECAHHLAEDVLALDGEWVRLAVLQEFSNATEQESMTSNLFGVLPPCVTQDSCAQPPFLTAESCSAITTSDLDRAWGEMACFAENGFEVVARCRMHAAIRALRGEKEVQKVAVVQMWGDRRQSKMHP